MPAWNPRPAWLAEAVTSALGQEGCDLELVVVDDGSAQPVADLLQDVDDDRLRIVRVAHGGVSAARNAGLEVARGSHVRFIDADDVLPRESTARLLQLAADGERLLAYGATVFCDEQLSPRWKVASRRRGDVAEACLLDRFPVTLPAILFPREVIDQVGEWDPAFQVCEDWDYVLRAAEQAPAAGTPDVALLYRRHDSSASHGDEAAWDGTLRVVERYFERHPDKRGTGVERQVRAMLSFMRATHRPRRQIWRSRHLWRAALLDPRAVLHGGAALLRTSRLGRRFTRSSRGRA